MGKKKYQKIHVKHAIWCGNVKIYSINRDYHHIIADIGAVAYENKPQPLAQSFESSKFSLDLIRFLISSLTVEVRVSQSGRKGI